MALYAIGDLHLSLCHPKEMDIFPGWENYIQRIHDNWHNTVKQEDTVVLCGDTSWAMKLEECEKDFTFLNNLPGQKIILKGNHDYWWTTLKKMNLFCETHQFSTLSFLHNNSYPYEKNSICGTRSWSFGLEDEFDERVFSREIGRLKASLQSATKEPIVFLHYPPIIGNTVTEEVLALLHDFQVKECYYGHLHGEACKYAFRGEKEGIYFQLLSADALQFKPHLIRP